MLCNLTHKYITTSANLQGPSSYVLVGPYVQLSGITPLPNTILSPGTTQLGHMHVGADVYISMSPCGPAATDVLLAACSSCPVWEWFKHGLSSNLQLQDLRGSMLSTVNKLPGSLTCARNVIIW